MSPRNPDPETFTVFRTVDHTVCWIGARFDGDCWQPVVAVSGPFEDEATFDPAYDSREDALVAGFELAPEALTEMRKYH